MTYLNGLLRAFDFSHEALRREFGLFMAGRLGLYGIMAILYATVLGPKIQANTIVGSSIGTIALAGFCAFLLIWDFVAGLAVSTRRLNNLDWAKALVAISAVPGVNVVFWVVLGMVKGKPGPEEKLENLTKLLNEIHAFIVSQGNRQDLLLFPCPEYGKIVADIAVVKIVGSGLFEASYADGNFAIKAIPQHAQHIEPEKMAA